MSRDILDYGDICDACGRKQRPDDSRVFLRVPAGDGRVMVLCSGCRQDSRQWPVPQVADPIDGLPNAMACVCLLLAMVAGAIGALILAIARGTL